MSRVNRLFSIILILMFVTAMIAPTVQKSFAAVSVSIDPTHGPVGTEVTVTGTIETYNGIFKVYIDLDGDGVLEDAEKVAEGSADGYNVETTFTVPDYYKGGYKVYLVDVSTGSKSYAVFTIETAAAIEVDQEYKVEGEDFTLTCTVTGGDSAWTDNDGDGTIDVDMQIRVLDSSGTELFSVALNDVEMTATAGKFQGQGTTDGHESDLSDLTSYPGVFKAVLDVDLDDDGTIEDDEKGLAEVTFKVGLLDVESKEYQRTETVTMQAYVNAGTYKWQIYDSDGNLVKEQDAQELQAAGTVSYSWTTAKDTDTGTYMIKLYDVNNDEVIREDSFTLKIATLTVEISTDADTVKRTDSITATIVVKYPNNVKLTSQELPNGFTVYVYCNGSLVTQFALDPNLHYDSANMEWEISWTVPKDQAVGEGYAFNVTANSITDVYDNVGPAETAGDAFKVDYADLAVAEITLVYPAAGNTLERTEQARASIKVTYSPGASILFTADDLEAFNVTVTDGAGHEYTIELTADNYNADLGVWIVKWNIPWNAYAVQAGTSYHFAVKADNIVDKYGNDGPTANVDDDQSFKVAPATIVITDLKTDKSIYESGDLMTVTFKALYPNGEDVTTVVDTFEVKIQDSNGNDKASEAPTYDEEEGVWKATIEIGSWNAGEYKVVIESGQFKDTAPGDPNAGPSADVTYTFDVIQVIIIEIDVSVGSVHFDGETVDLFVAARRYGKPYDVDVSGFTVTVFRPDGASETASVTKLDTGLYKISYTLPADAPEGGYVVKVEVFAQVSDYVYARGYGIKSFSVSPTFNNWNEVLGGLNDKLDQMNSTLNDVSASLTDLASMISEQFESLSSLVSSGFSTLEADVENVLSAIADLEGMVADSTEAVLSAIADSTEEVLGAISDLSEALGELPEVPSEIAEIKSMLTDVSSNVNATLAAVNGLSSELAAAKSEILTAVNSAVSKLSSAIDSAVSSVKSAVNSAASSVKDAVSGVASTVSDVKSKIDSVSSAVESLSSDLADFRNEAKASSSDLGTYVLASAVLTIVVLILVAATLAKVYRG